MQRAIIHHPANEWPAAEASDSVTLDYDSRHRRRLKLVSDSGAALLLDLERAVAMAHGDGLRTETGQWIRVQAAPEELVEARTADPLIMLQLAWHIGNRHIAAAITSDTILIRPDPVIEAMLRDNGATLRRIVTPFQPLRGAYHSQHGAHAHSHDHGHGHHHHDDPHGQHEHDDAGGRADHEH
jgi:urease accessory protein